MLDMILSSLNNKEQAGTIGFSDLMVATVFARTTTCRCPTIGHSTTGPAIQSKVLFVEQSRQVTQVGDRGSPASQQ